MTSLTTEETGTAQAPTAGDKPKPNKKATRAPRRAPVAPAKSKAGRKATPAKKAPKGRTKAKVAAPAKSEVRGGSKTARILELLKRPGGVMPATHKGVLTMRREEAYTARSVRLSGALH